MRQRKPAEGERIRRRREFLEAVPLQSGRHTLYSAELSAVPSRVWRAAFLRPPPRLTATRAAPGLARLELHGARVLFRTTPTQLHAWLRRIDRWIAYANSVVEE